MTTPKSSDPNQDENTARFRAILSSSEEEEKPAHPPSPSHSLFDLLPRAVKKEEPQPEANRPKAQTPPRSPQTLGQRAAKPAAAAPQAARPAARYPEPTRPVAQEPAGPSKKMRFGPAFWTITGILSLIVNVVLISIVIILLGLVSRLNIQLGSLMQYAQLPEQTVRGLYDNFVKMDEAHIKTTIPVSAQIPVQFDLELNTQTEVVLSQDTPINQARVTLSTGGLNITNAPANIILPAGTRLPVVLNLTVPVDKQVPVNLVVPVDIALNQTDLHEPFVGLQSVVQPLYCLLDPKATSPQGVMLCTPTSTP